MVWPAALYVAGLALLARVSALVWRSEERRVGDAGGAPWPAAAAEVLIEPASRSAGVIVWVFVQLGDAPGAKGPVQHANVPSLSSVTEKGPARVTLLELVIV